jgi:hypothetical protein
VTFRRAFRASWSGVAGQRGARLYRSTTERRQTSDAFYLARNELERALEAMMPEGEMGTKALIRHAAIAIVASVAFDAGRGPEELSPWGTFGVPFAKSR